MLLATLAAAVLPQTPGDRLAPGLLVLSLVETSVPLFGGALHVAPPFATTPGFTAVGGEFSVTLPVPPSPIWIGVEVITQAGVFDPGAADPSGVALSNGLATRILP